MTNRRYDAAMQLLAELVEPNDIDTTEADRRRDLLAKAQRLADDQGRLAEVVAGLAQDEDRARTELLTRRLSAATPKTAEATHPGNPAGHGPPARCVESEDGGPTAVGPPVDHDGLAIWLLGPCRLVYRGRRLKVGNGDRAAAVLRYLAAQPTTGVHKEQLAVAFWPEADERSARRSLHQVIYNIRRRLLDAGADAELQFVNDRYVLGDRGRWRDIDELQAAMERARWARDRNDLDTMAAAYERVDVLYRGDFLAEHLYADWAEAPRRHFRQLHREAVSVLLENHRRRGTFCRVVQLAERLLELDPIDEDVNRRLMEAQVELGYPQLAAAAFSNQVQVLADEYGLQPSAESMAMARELFPQYLDE